MKLSLHESCPTEKIEDGSIDHEMASLDLGGSDDAANAIDHDVQKITDTFRNTALSSSVCAEDYIEAYRRDPSMVEKRIYGIEPPVDECLRQDYLVGRHGSVYFKIYIKRD